MHKRLQKRVKPELRDLIREASVSLARLDAERLEELALSCEALNRDLSPSGRGSRVELTRQTQEAVGEMAMFGRVLKATRSNLDVLNRLRESRAARLEYGSSAVVDPLRRAGGLG